MEISVYISVYKHLFYEHLSAVLIKYSMGIEYTTKHNL